MAPSPVQRGEALRFQGDSIDRGNQTGFQSVSHLFKEKIGVQNDRIFRHIWDHAFSTRPIRWDVSKPLSLEALKEMESALKATLVYQGKGIGGRKPGSNLQIYEILQFLQGRLDPTLALAKKWLTEKTIKALLVKKDPEFLKAMEEEFRLILKACSKELPIPGTGEEVLFQSFVGNIVSLLPYVYPERGESFAIPLKVNGIWKCVSYRIDEKIELTPAWFSSPITAYGLTSPEGPPLLIFLGTTYPAGEGCIATLLSDFTPGLSVGHAPYLFGKKNLEKWLENKHGIHLYGVSLGGALAFQVLRHHKEKVAQVEAFNPPGLYPWDWKETYSGASPDIRIYLQENDLVAGMGTLPEGDRVSVYRVFTEKRGNFLKAHVLIYSGSERVTFLKSDPVYENNRIPRKILTALHLILGFFIVFLPVACFYLLYLLFDCLFIRRRNALIKYN